MLELRDFINKIRGQYGLPYPLADRRPYVGGSSFSLRRKMIQGCSWRASTRLNVASPTKTSVGSRMSAKA